MSPGTASDPDLEAEVLRLRARIAELENECRAVHRQAEEQLAGLRGEKGMLCAVVASIGDEVWFADVHGRFTLANPTALREFHLHGLDQTEVITLASSAQVSGSQTGAFRNVRAVIGRDFSAAMRILWPEPVAAEIIAHFRHTLETGEPYYSPRFVNPRHDVSIVESYEWELHRRTLPDGQHGVICYYFESTKLREAEEALRETEERLRMTLDAARVGTFEFWPQTGRLLWDDVNRRIWGLRPGAEWAYTEALKRLHPDDRERVEGIVRGALDPASDGSYDCEYRILLPDGSVHWTVAKGRVYFDGEAENCRAVRMVGIQLDITEQKRAEQALRESEERFRVAQEMSPDGFTIFRPVRDTEGRVVDFTWVYENETIARINGTDRQAVIGCRLLNLFPGLRDTEFLKAYQHVAQTGETRVLEAPYQGDSIPNQTWFRAVVVRMGSDIAVLAQDITERKQAELETRSLAAFPEQNPSPVLRVNPDQRLEYANEAGRSWLAAKGALGGDPLPAEVRALVERASREDRIVEEEIGCEHGRTFWFSAVRPPGEAYVNLYGRDVTERKQVEQRIRQTQKLESLGLLAGGVAHDLNNLLVGVIGNASLAREFVPEESPAAGLMDSVVKAGEQAAHLTRQMLAYSGKGKFIVEPLDLSVLLPDMSGLVRPSIPNKIRLDLNLEKDLPPIEADRGQIQQVYMNLVINASEAIGYGDGLISVRTGVQNVDDRYIQLHPETAGLEPGEYVFLRVRDTGCGMDDATRAKIFDPFFSTKFTGRGLGLAAVSGIVRGHHGAITVTSATGEGSCFTVLFPAAARIAVRTPDMAERVVANGSGVVLVIDDEHVVRDMAQKALERHGYTVLVADGGPAAIDIAKRYPGSIDLAVLDLSMPGLNGQETLPELRKIRPEVKVFVSSGYSEAETMTMFRGQKVSGFVQKPYTAAALAEKVRTALG